MLGASDGITGLLGVALGEAISELCRGPPTSCGRDPQQVLLTRLTSWSNQTPGWPRSGVRRGGSQGLTPPRTTFGERMPPTLPMTTPCAPQAGRFAGADVPTTTVTAKKRAPGGCSRPGQPTRRGRIRSRRYVGAGQSPSAPLPFACECERLRPDRTLHHQAYGLRASFRIPGASTKGRSRCELV